MRTDPKISLKEIEKIDRITRLNRPFTDEEIEQLRKLPNILKDLVPSLKGKRKGGKVSRKRKGGSVSRKRGGKIMVGYKAGGKV